MKTLLLPALLAAGTLLTAPAHAQRAFQVGPTVGATLSTVHFDDVPDRTAMPLRAGFAAGLTGSYQSLGHWGVQVAGLFVQQGYTQRYESPTGDYQHTTYLRLNYLRLPLQLTFSAHPSGRGLRFFAGPYVGALLGGQHIEESTYQGVRARNRGQVMVADTRHQEVLFVIDPVYQPEYTRYSRRFDVGLQGGVGYQVGPARLQVGYTLGLRNLAATTVYQVGTSSFAEVGDPYRTRGLEASLTYLFGPKG